jgi:hypothetical protein
MQFALQNRFCRSSLSAHPVSSQLTGLGHAPTPSLGLSTGGVRGNFGGRVAVVRGTFSLMSVRQGGDQPCPVDNPDFSSRLAVQPRPLSFNGVKVSCASERGPFALRVSYFPLRGQTNSWRSLDNSDPKLSWLLRVAHQLAFSSTQGRSRQANDRPRVRSSCSSFYPPIGRSRTRRRFTASRHRCAATGPTDAW